MKPWDLSVKKPVTVFMGLICILVMGLISLQQIKLAFLPSVDFPFMGVEVSYPNQSPDILEREVTKPLEEAISTMKGIKRINSRTSADGVNIWMQFDWGMELDLLRLELGLKIEEARPDLPEEVRQIFVYSFNTNDMAVVEGRISAPGIDLSENYDLLERHVKQKLERIPGVAKVDIGGVLPKEVYIDLRLDKINEHRVDVGQIVQALSRDNLTLSAGKLKANGLVYNLRGQGKIRELEEYGELRINEQGLKLKDIADILYEEPPIGYRRHLDGAQALALEVYKESTANTVEVATQVREMLEGEIAEDPVLQGISLFVWGDQAKEIRNGLDGLTKAGLFGALFAVIVLFLFLRNLRATLIVATAIPLSIIGSFIFINAFGYTLNILTMMGLMLAVGMLVDNAVVVLESIYAKKLQGLSAQEATREGTREVIIALIAATATTMIIFLSLAVADSSEMSVWLGAMGMVISVTLGVSLLISTAVIPLFASRFLDKLKPASKELRLVRWYGGILDWCLARPKRVFALLMVLVVSSFWPMQQLQQFEGTSFKNDKLFFRLQFNDFFFLSEAEAAVYEVEAFLETKREDWGLESIYSYMQENLGQTTLTFDNEHLSYERYREIRNELREGLPVIAGVEYILEDDEETSSQALVIQLFGTETNSLKQEGEKIAELLRGRGDLFDVRSGERSRKKELQVSIDREQAALYDVHPEMISEVFGFTLRGTYLPRFRMGDRERDVSLGLRIEDRATIEDVSQIRIGNDVPLGAVANFAFTDRDETIRRVDRKAHHRVRATYEGDDYSTLMEEVEVMMNNYSFPPGVTWSWSNRVLQEQEEENGMLINMLLALLLVYLVMASLFESLHQPLTILTATIFFSFVGVFWTLYFTRTEMELMVMIGLMILIGIVVNNGIILMDRYNQLRRSGQSVEEAARLAAHDRIRPILMTAATTVIGLIPMAVGKAGITGAYYFPLARTVIGGLTTSTLLTLVGLPLMLITGHKMTQFVVRLARRIARFRPSLPWRSKTPKPAVAGDA